MAKRYDPARREAALACLAALGSVSRVSELTGISVRSLNRWAREERRARRNAIRLLTQETERAADAADIRLQEAQARLERTQAQLAQLRQKPAALPSDAAAPPPGASQDPRARLEQLALVNMLQEAMRLSESLGEAIDEAPLGQRATALNHLLDKILKILTLVPRQEEVLVRVEFRDPDGTAHATPPWARGDSGQPGALPGGGLRPALRQDRNGQAGHRLPAAGE